MKHPEDMIDADKPMVDISNLPISLQKYYKNSRWWPVDPPLGKSFQNARKKELSSNFKDQLITIWNVSHSKLYHIHFSIISVFFKV